MRRLLALLAFLIFPAVSFAQYSTVSCANGETGTCRQATDCSQANVQAAVNASAAGGTGQYNVSLGAGFDGDAVYVPAGSCTWSSSVSFSNKNVEILGGIGGTTTITDTTGDAFDPSGTNTGNSGAAFRISGFTFNGSSSGHLMKIDWSSATAWAGFFRVDHLTINYSTSGDSVVIDGPAWGLFDHLNMSWSAGNFIIMSDFLASECVTSPGNTAVYMGEYAGRTLPIALGSNQAVYVEDSTFTYTGLDGGGAISDSSSGGQRFVFRYNTVTGPTFHYSHWTRGGGGGYCYNGEWDGHKVEIYNNTYNGSGSTGYPFRFGSGTGVIFNNTITGYADPTIHVDETRGAGGEGTNATTYSCDGSQPMDGNAGDPNAPGWPCAGQVGTACINGSCSRSTMNSVPLLVWNNGAQAGCSTGGSCTNSITVNVDGCQGSYNTGTCTRTMTNYISSTPHVVSGALNGAVDYCQGSVEPAICGIYSNTYSPMVHPSSLQGGGTPTYTLSTSKTGSGLGTITCTPSGAGIAAGTSYSCTSTPNAGYYQGAISGCGGTLSGSTYSGVMPASNCNISDEFKALVAHPTFSPVGGIYSTAQSVTISSTTAGATFCYTLDTTTPTDDGNGNCTGASLTYTGAISIASSKTITVKGTKAGLVSSSVQSATYTITAGGNAFSTGVSITSGVAVQ